MLPDSDQSYVGARVDNPSISWKIIRLNREKILAKPYMTCYIERATNQRFHSFYHHSITCHSWSVFWKK
jgi:hypothetical protein